MMANKRIEENSNEFYITDEAQSLAIKYLSFKKEVQNINYINMNNLLDDDS
jgi:cyclophilin family peptidyl-prolyl cis-trans isomerase